MSYTEIKGNIFNSKAMAIVNTVNCVGAMGKGLALEYKLRYPDMFYEYQKICARRLLRPGQILPYTKSKPIILNFAIKDDWKDDSRPEWIEETLQKFTLKYNSMGITSVAFPWMGAMNGGLPFNIIQSLTRKYLSDLKDIDIEVYEYDPNTPCPLFKTLKALSEVDIFHLKGFVQQSNIQERYWVRIFEALNDDQIMSLDNLCHYMNNGKRIIGKTNIERLYRFLTEYSKTNLNLGFDHH